MTEPRPPASIRVLYDFLQVRGGAERVSLMLANELPAELLVHAIDPDEFDQQLSQRVASISTTRLSSNPMFRARAAWRGFRRLPQHPAVSAVLFSGHYAPLAVDAFPDARRVLYLHGPPLPFLWDAQDPTVDRRSPLLRWAMRRALAELGHQYLDAVAKMHEVLANSTFVARAFESATGRVARVLHPPVADAFFAAPRTDGDYYLSIARHEPMKRVERIVEAFLQMPDLQLRIAGSGSCTQALKQQAQGAANIVFLGALDTDALASCLAGARASVHIGRNEPFGLAMAESLATGTPVIASNEGAAAELVVPGRNGMLVDADPDSGALCAAVQAVQRGGCDFDAASRISSSVGHLRQSAFIDAMREALRAT